MEHVSCVNFPQTLSRRPLFVRSSPPLSLRPFRENRTYRGLSLDVAHSAFQDRRVAREQRVQEPLRHEVDAETGRAARQVRVARGGHVRVETGLGIIPTFFLFFLTERMVETGCEALCTIEKVFWRAT